MPRIFSRFYYIQHRTIAFSVEKDLHFTDYKKLEIHGLLMISQNSKSTTRNRIVYVRLTILRNQFKVARNSEFTDDFASLFR